MNAVQGTERIANALTIDVEDYFQVSAFAPYIERSAWETTPCRIERNIDRVLDLLNQCGANTTFFTLGWLAQRYPRIVRDISSPRSRGGEPRAPRAPICSNCTLLQMVEQHQSGS